MFAVCYFGLDWIILNFVPRRLAFVCIFVFLNHKRILSIITIVFLPNLLFLNPQWIIRYTLRLVAFKITVTCNVLRRLMSLDCARATMISYTIQNPFVFFGLFSRLLLVVNAGDGHTEHEATSCPAGDVESWL